MLSTVLGIDAVTAVQILVKTGASAASLAAAGSALVPLALPRFDDATTRSVRRVAVAAAALAAAFSVLHLPVSASLLMGGSVAGAFDPAIVGMVAGSPVGASLWVRLAGLALLCMAVVERPTARFAAGLGAVLVCGSFALRGHSLEEPRLVLAGLVTLHLLGLAFWIGILYPLHRLAGRDTQAAGALAVAFSRRAVWIVPAVAAAGAVLFVVLTGDPVAALGTPYGQFLAVKLALFAPLLGLAAINKYRLTPALRTGVPRAGAHLRRSIRLEVVAVLAILATTAALTTLSSPGMEAGGAATQGEAPTPEKPA